MRATATRMLIISIVAILLLTGLGLFYVWRHHRVITMGAELGKVTENYRELCRERDLLQAEYETLRRNPDNQVKARELLDMRPPTPEQIIKVPAVARSGQEAK
jgi:cell division protein FtsL